MPTKEIKDLTEQLVRTLSPLQIYLFGSVAEGTDTEDSDFDFYIVADDDVHDIVEMTAKAYCSIRDIKQRPVDIIIGNRDHFEVCKEIPSIEKEVFQKGFLLYSR